ncbi:hypothetical protein [Rasiella sp. SM2506]
MKREKPPEGGFLSGACLPEARKVVGDYKRMIPTSPNPAITTASACRPGV